MTPLPVRTERLLLRVTEPGDLDDLLAYYSDPGITPYVPFDAYPDAEAFADRFQRFLDGNDPREVGQSLNVLLDLDGRVVGDVMLRMHAAATPDPMPVVGEIGWVLHPSYVGRGLATEAARAVLGVAFDHYGLHRVHAQLDPRNTASAALCERLGLRHEGTTRRDYWSKGEWSDTAVYGLLREEWAAAGFPG